MQPVCRDCDHRSTWECDGLCESSRTGAHHAGWPLRPDWPDVKNIERERVIWYRRLVVGIHGAAGTARAGLDTQRTDPRDYARKPIHLQSPEDRKAVPEIKNLWVDIGALNGEEARAACELRCDYL